MVSLEKMIKMVDYGNLTKIITQTLLIVGGPTCKLLLSKLNYFGVDNTNVSKIVMIRVTSQIQLDYFPHMQCTYCMAH
jgi:hypothetical protein